MNRGVIKKTALDDLRTAAIALSVIAAICAAILGWDWRHVYNSITGPYTFDSALAAAPGTREFVRASGKLVPTGIVEELTLRFFRGAAETKSVTAQYLAMNVDGGILIVKTENDFAGSTVEGKLVPLTVSVGGSLPAGTRTYPYMIDAEYGYRTRTNLFVWIAAPLFLLVLPFLANSLWTMRRVASHSAITKLKKFGAIDQVITRIEDELMFAGDRGRTGPLWITPSWIVRLQPTLSLFAIADLMGVAARTTTSKSGPKTQLIFWSRDASIEEKMSVSGPEAVEIMIALRAKLPWAVVDDPEGFGKRWDTGRTQVEQEVDARRKAVTR